MKNKKTNSKLLNSRIFLRYLLIIFIIIAIVSFALFFYFKDKVNLSPSTLVTYIGLPSGFSSTFGYYHGFGGGGIGLYDANGNGYVSGNGISFTAVNKVNAGLPSDYKPIVGYYAPFNLGKVYLWDANGKNYAYPGANGKFYQISLEVNVKNGLPSDFKPVIGYYHEIGSNIGKGKISLWDANGRTFVGDSTGKFIQTPNFTSNNNLPAGQAPKFAYYYDKGTKKEIHFWYNNNGVLKLYIYSLINGVWKMTPTDLSTWGLPPRIPNSIYYDRIRGKIVIFFGSEAYESYETNNKISFVPYWTTKQLKSIQQTSTGTSGVLLNNGQQVSFTTNTGDFKTSLIDCQDIIGDINGDGLINGVDVQKEINAALGLEAGCDLNGNGGVDATDIQMVINGALGLSVCPGYAELAAMNKIQKSEVSLQTTTTPSVNYGGFLNLNSELYKLASAKSTTLTAKAQERKTKMLELADKNPGLFLSLTIPKSQQDTTFKSVSQYLEKQVSEEGKLEIMEKPHIGTDGKNIHVEGSGFDYFLKIGTKKYNLKFADNSMPNVIGGAQIKVNGVSLDNYLVTSSAQTKALTVVKNVDTSINLGVQKIAIIITKAPGEPDPDVSSLQQVMEKTNEYYQEISYGQASLQWDVYGPYETEGSWNYWFAADPYVNFNNYKRIISVDNRNCSGCATVGVNEYQTNTQRFTASVTYIVSNIYNDLYWKGILIHELGHNFGDWHANSLRCDSGKTIENVNCYSEEYGDPYDVMGFNIYESNQMHMNLINKEIIGWINNKIQTTVSNGPYLISLFERMPNEGILGLKVPRKYDDFGNPTDFYYLEYRLPIGFDSFISQVQPNNGPQIRIFENIFTRYGTSASNLLDTTPSSVSSDTYYRDNIEIGQTFIDPNTNVKIKTISADSEKAVVDVTLNDQKCIRNSLVYDINPNYIKGAYYETFIFNFFAMNKDAGCSSRNVYLKVESPDIDNYFSTWLSRYDYANGMSTNWNYPSLFKSGEIFNGTLSISTYNLFGKPFHVKISLVDVDRGVMFTKEVIIEDKKYNDLINWPNQDVAKKFIYSSYNMGYYLLNKNGIINRIGETWFTTDNGPIINANSKKFSSIVYNNGLELITLDSNGNLYDFGELSLLNTYLLKADFINTYFKPPLLSCNIAVDVKLVPTNIIYLLDSYGGVFKSFEGYFTGSVPFSCITWDGKTNSYRPGQDHARELEPSKDIYGNYGGGYYILSKDGTIYACGSADISFTKLNQALPSGFGAGDRYAVAFELNQEKGIVMLDSYGEVYTTGTMTYQGAPKFNKDIARDIKFIPDASIGNADGSIGYGILSGDGNIYECQAGACKLWQENHPY